MLQEGSIGVESMAGIGFRRLALTGPLTGASAPALRRAITTALLDHERVVIDVSGLDVVEPSCLAVFSAAFERAGGWPRVRMVLSGPADGAVAAIRRAGYDRYVAVCTSIAAAIDRLDQRPARVRRSRPLDVGPVAPSQARTLATGTCEDWLVPRAATAKCLLLINELTVNALQHRPTYLRAIVELDDDTVQLRIREWPGTPAHDVSPLTRTTLGVLSDGWSAVPSQGSTTVSATIQLPP